MSSVKDNAASGVPSIVKNKRWSRSSRHEYENAVELTSVTSFSNDVTADETSDDDERDERSYHEEMETLTPGDLIAFAWQISKGMVSQLPGLFFRKNY